MDAEEWFKEADYLRNLLNRGHLTYDAFTDRMKLLMSQFEEGKNDRNL